MVSRQNQEKERVKQREQIIKIREGYELNLNVSTDISCGLSFMNPAYRQAERALVEIIHQTKRFQEYVQKYGYLDSLKEQQDDLLFQYSGNIIAFVASRGGGKTRTMLSFAKWLGSDRQGVDCLAPGGVCSCGKCDAAERTERLEELQNCKFITCAPISPATLEGKQNILYVVLSRLYNLAEDLLERDLRGRRISERDKSELYAAFRQCLSGINGIKCKQEDLSEFSILRDIGDGLSLQRRFHELVQIILKIAVLDRDPNSRYLVLQLDDTDSQVENGYAVLEDVRKYLLIPNLVILMSTDLELMHNVILQSHLGQYKALLRTEKKKFLVADLNRTTRKYIDKLIPPSHMVHLPQMHKVMEDRNDRLVLQYVDEQNQPVFDWMKQGGQWNLQDAVLSMIYRKTGVLFAAPSCYLHNVIPRTMRGLNQLIYLLKEMEEDLIPLREEEFADSVTFAKAILKRAAVAEDNLNRFTEYFTDTWVKAKIREVKDAEFLKRFYESAASNRVRLAMQYLCKRHKIPGEEYQVYSRYALDELMTKIEQVNRTQDDFLLYFSIRTLFTLESHRRIWQCKGTQAEAWLSKPREADQILFFDYEPEQIQTQSVLRSQAYYVEIPVGDPRAERKVAAPEGLMIALQFDQPVGKKFYGELPWYSQKMLMHPGKDPRNVVFNLFNCFYLPLRLTKLLKQRTARTGKWMDLTQKQVYWMQELALQVVANWDVQASLYKQTNVFKGVDVQDRGRTPSGKISALIDTTFDVIRELNSGKLEYVSPELWAVLGDPDRSYQGLKELMYESVQDYQNLRLALILMTQKSTPKELLRWLTDSQHQEEAQAAEQPAAEMPPESGAGGTEDPMDRKQQDEGGSDQTRH